MIIPTVTDMDAFFLQKLDEEEREYKRMEELAEWKRAAPEDDFQDPPDDELDSYEDRRG